MKDFENESEANAMRMLRIAAIVMMMLAGAVRARAECVSVTELREQAEALGRWSQTYEAHGRTIAVDVPVIIPEVERVPIVQVSAPLGKETLERLGLPVTEADGWAINYEDANLLQYLKKILLEKSPLLGVLTPRRRSRLAFKSSINIPLHYAREIGDIPAIIITHMRLIRIRCLPKIMNALLRTRKIR